MKNSKNREPQAEVLSDPDREKIMEYIRCCLSPRARKILALREEGIIWEVIGRKMHCHPTSAHHEHVTSLEQIRLAMEAPWMRWFRSEVLDEGAPALPEAVLALDSSEIAAMWEVSPAQKKGILQFRFTAASKIAREMNLSLRAVLGVLKTEGEWPSLKDSTVLAALLEAGDNATEAARRLKLEGSRVRHRLRKLGVHSSGSRWRK